MVVSSQKPTNQSCCQTKAVSKKQANQARFATSKPYRDWTSVQLKLSDQDEQERPKDQLDPSL